MIHVGAGACRFPLDDVYLHVLDFDSHQQEVYLPHNDIFQVVSGEEKVKKTRCVYSIHRFAHLQTFMVSGHGVTVHTRPYSHPDCHCNLISQHVLYLYQSNFCPFHSSRYNSEDVFSACYISHLCLLIWSICSGPITSFTRFVFVWDFLDILMCERPHPQMQKPGLALPLWALQNVFWELGLDRPPQTVLRGVDLPGQAEAAEQDTCIKLHPHLSGLCSHDLCSEPSGIQPWCILLFLGSGRRDDGLVHSPVSGMAGRE